MRHAGEQRDALPQPDDDARAASNALAERIRAAIAAAGGCIGFEQYMELALYSPGLGYYSGGSAKFGPAGDFVTAPEISPLFAHCIARPCAEILKQTGGEVLELGAGSGTLAASLLSALAAAAALPARYCILELSAELRERQQQTIASLPAEIAARVEWLDELPQQPFDGVVLANEVIDALPCSVFRIDSAEPDVSPNFQPNAGPNTQLNIEPDARPSVERHARLDVEPGVEPDAEPKVEPVFGQNAEPGDEPGVGPDAEPKIRLNVGPDFEPEVGAGVEPGFEPGGEPSHGAALEPRVVELGVAADGDAFVWQPRAASPELRACVQGIEAELPSALPAAYRSECRPSLAAWVSAVVQPLRRGAVLFIDYGLPRHEYYHPQRSGGTLLCHYRHRVHEDPFFLPGLQDIGAWVDFSAVARAGVAAGCELAAYTTQAHFLIGCGLGELLTTEPDDERKRLMRAQQVKQLMLPGEMGERFKAMVLTRGGVAWPAPPMTDLSGML